jgi:hypothetical protein
MDELGPRETQYRILTVAGRVRRYAMLRAAQRALSPIRSLPGRLPGEDTLRQIRLRLGELAEDQREGADVSAEAATETDRSAVLADLDRMLADVAREFRSIAAEISFAELRANLPRLRESQPHEVVALLDLCLEDEEDAAQFVNVVDYLATLLATEFRRGERVLGTDPVMVSGHLRESCERFGGHDPDEVRAHVQALEEIIRELNQAESVDPVMERGRALKTQLGRLIFVPEIFRKIVEYNIVAANRIEDDLEAERTLHGIDLDETGTLDVVSVPSRPTKDLTAEPDAEPESPEVHEPELRERRIIEEVAEAVGHRLLGTGPGAGRAQAIAEALDLAFLKPWERQVVTQENGGDAELAREVVIVGLMLRQLDDLRDKLQEIGFPPQRLEEHWLPHLDAQVQSAIAERLRASEHAEAKRLAQTRARFLFRILEARRRAAPPPDAEQAPANAYLQEWQTGGSPERQAESPSAAPGPAPLPATSTRGRFAKARPIALAATLAGLLVVAALQFGISTDSRSVDLLPASLLVQLSTHLESGYRDGAGLGPRFFGTVSQDWNGLSATSQQEEALQIADRLRWSGVEEVMLFDKGRRLVARSLRGELIHPRP